MRLSIAASAALAALAGCATPEAGRTIAPYKDPTLDALTASRLEAFRDEAEFIRYLKGAKAAAKARGIYWAKGDLVRLAQAPAAECVDEPCPDGEDIVLTGSRISGKSNSFTNTQKAGVDEGDIVKEFGRFLIVLQDGRLFSIDTKPAAGRMALVDRANVYRDPVSDAWYDEIVISGNRIAALGYSYDGEASEIATFTIGPGGRFAREAVFHLSSDDYYSGDNYATRLVDDKLILYTPLYLADIDPERLDWPVVSRELPDGRRSAGVPLFSASDILKPVLRTLDPVIHAVSVCPLGGAVSGELECRTTAAVGPFEREFYVSRTDAFMWLAHSGDDLDPEGDIEDCAADRKPRVSDAPPAALFRIPLGGAPARALLVRGYPRDQFALETSATEFRALLDWSPVSCDPDALDAALRYFRTPLAAFGDDLRTAPITRFTNVPSPGAPWYETRFTDDFVVYGGRASRYTGAPDADEATAAMTARVVAAPVDRPRRASVLEVPHGVIRAERMGDDIVMTGYRDDKGLGLSLIDLDGDPQGRPRLAGTMRLEGRYEAEGRSHAFNSRVDEDGAAIFGVPTIRAAFESGRWPWRSDVADVSFMTADKDGRLAGVGEFAARADAEDAAYECEVSCVDWYGNSRPLFKDGRIFALSGVELVEGVVTGGRIAEVGRLNLTAPPVQAD